MEEPKAFVGMDVRSGRIAERSEGDRTTNDLANWFGKFSGLSQHIRENASLGSLYQIRRTANVRKVNADDKLMSYLRVKPAHNVKLPPRKKRRVNQTDDDLAFNVYSHNEEWIGIPRFLGLQLFGYPLHVRTTLGNVEDTLWDGVVCNSIPSEERLQPDALKSLWEKGWRLSSSDWNNAIRDRAPVLLNYGAQERTMQQTTLSHHFQKTPTLIGVSATSTFQEPLGGGGLLCLPCGWGKTRTFLMAVFVLALHLRSRLCVLVALDRIEEESLGGQWRKSIEEVLPGARVGWLHGDRVDVEGAHIVLSTVQSLSAPGKYSTQMLARFGCVAVDEAHVIGAEYFSQAVRRCSAAYMVGLSATPERKDRLTRLVYWFLGPLVFRPSREQRLANSLSCHVFALRWSGGSRKEIRDRDDEILLPATLRCLRNDKVRNQLAVELTKMILDRGRQLLVFSDCTNHLDLIDQAIAETYPTIIRDLYYSGMGLASRKKTQLYEMLASEFPDHADKTLRKRDLVQRLCALREEKKANEPPPSGPRLVLRTYQMASKAFDDPALDAVLLLMPPSSTPEQTVGRIRRRFTNRETGLSKPKPEIWDLVDTFGPFERQYSAREKWYATERFSREEVELRHLRDVDLLRAK